MDRITYKDAGVDVNKADKLVKHLGISGYGAVIDIDKTLPQFTTWNNPYWHTGCRLVMGTDGVGTKILVAEQLNVFDTIGIALYTVTGVEIALLINLDPVICVALGTITACFGGVIRDILCNEIPVIFRKEIYASACIAGGALYVILHHYGIAPGINAILSELLVVIIRTLAVIYEVQLPSIYSKSEL